MAIKDEIQGPSGYLKKVREDYMPDTKTMAKLAYEKYSNECPQIKDALYVEENADEILKGLFLAETSIFQEKNADIMLRVLPYYFKNIYGKADAEYNETNNKFKKLYSAYNMCKEGTCSFEMFLETISDVTVPIIDVVSFSQKQSAKCRVGETLQNHLANIFDACGVKYETQQQKSDGGTIMDFVIPSFKAIEEMPDQVINIECQTTLKDRFRLTTGKSTDGKIKRYLATVTGAGIVTSRDFHDFSIEKVKEIIVDNNVTLVVLKEVKDQIEEQISQIETKMKESKTGSVGTITDVDISKIRKLSDKKIITYAELIKKNIRSTMLYWN